MTKVQMWIAGALALLVLVGLAFCAGEKHQATNDKLAENHAQIVKQDSVTRLDSAKVDTARKHSDIIGAYRAKVRAKVGVSHDTITVHDSVAVVSPEIAQLIEADDSTIAAQARTIALQDTLIASLRVGLNLRDGRIGILEKEKRPLLGLKSGIVIGAGAVIAILFAAHR